MEELFNLSQGSAYFDRCPLAFAVVEVEFDQQKQPSDLIFRYGNPALERLVGKPMDTMTDKRIFKEIAPQDWKEHWLPHCVTAAYGGELREMHGFSVLTNRYWKVQCYSWTKQGFCGCFVTDETREVRERKHLEYMANHDISTGAYSKNSYQELCLNHRSGGPMGAVYVDVNDLKMCNDFYGHEMGDALIATVAQKIFYAIRHSGAKVYRVGGDEFVVLWNHCSQEAVEQLCDLLEAQFINETIEEMPEQLASVGYSWMAEVSDIEELVGQADEQMYTRKQSFHRHHL